MTDDWFVANLRELPWVRSESFGTCCIFESDDRAFPHVGYTLAVLAPGQPSGLYHREATQEDFLVLAGECVLLVEGEERRLGPGDFFHSPPGTEHILVGAGERPCLVLMAGSRRADNEIVYPRSELALRHGAGVEAETATPREAYAPFAPWEPAAPLDLRDLL